MDKVKDDLDVTVNYANLGDHIPKIDRDNITVKEGYHAQYHGHPFQNIPRVIIRYLDFEVVIELNCFPVKVGLSPYYIPWTLVYTQPLYYNTHFTIPFGVFSQASNEKTPKNSNVSRTIDGIYLRSLDNIQGGRDIFYLNSQTVITRRKII